MDKEREVMSVKAYTELRSKPGNIIQPQLVHYYIRKGEIDQIECECCGAKVISVKQADSVFVKEPEAAP